MNDMNKMYDSICMPAHLEATIMTQTQAPVKKRAFCPKAAVAVALTLVCMLGCNPTARAAVHDMIVTTFPALDMTIYQETTPNGGSVTVIDTMQTDFAYVENGRLYFTGNGEHMDITDQVSEASPFFYIYEEQAYEIYLVVGYSGTIENFGTYKFIKENGTWFTGGGNNYLNMDNGHAYPWVSAVWEKLDVLWPMPGSEH